FKYSTSKLSPRLLTAIIRDSDSLETIQNKAATKLLNEGLIYRVRIIYNDNSSKLFLTNFTKNKGFADLNKYLKNYQNSHSFVDSLPQKREKTHVDFDTIQFDLQMKNFIKVVMNADTL